MVKNGFINKPIEGKNPLKLKLVAEHQVTSLFGLSTQMTDFYVNNSFAYILERTGKILVVDINNHEKPQRVDLLATRTNGIYLADNYLYAIGDRSMAIYDVTGSGKPRQIGYFPDKKDYIEHIYVKGNIAYITGRDLKLINVKDKTAPKLMNTYKAGSPAPETGGCSFGGYRPRCLLAGNKRLLVLSIGTIACENDTGNKLFYEIADISNSSQPIYMGSFSSRSGEFLSSNGAFLNGSDSWIMIGSSIIDISEPASPVVVDEQPICRFCIGSNGDLVTTVDRTIAAFPKLLLIDISNPVLPVIAGSTESPFLEKYICKQQIVGDYVYLLTCGEANKLLVFKMK
ncbi:MAG: hypothetical protein OEW15_17985 [Nitrospirota bacterium]|nr:hypothetical protein [Nitrospirota bacterium]